MKFKLLRRRLSISAPRMTIKTHIPWPWRALAAIGVLGISVALGLWAYDLGKSFTGLGPDLKAEVEQLRQQVQTLSMERDQLATNGNNGNSGDSRLNLERAMQEQLANQIKVLEMENGKLKDDLAFFENLSGGAAAPTGVSIKRFEVEPDTVPGQMRYRLLMVQGGRSNKDFAGNLQLVLTLQQGGKAVMITLPKPLTVGVGAEIEADPNPYQISFRFYKRIEGTFRIPADATLKQVQAKVFERGTLSAQQMIVMK